MDKITTIQAAMFAALGQQTKISRNGYSIVFIEPQCGRHDLSSDDDRAAAQARNAGLDIDAVTAQQIEAYQAWYERMYQDRRINQARILITRTFGMERGRELVPTNRVALIDGWGCDIDSVAVPCREYWDATARNRIGGVGAVCSEPDYESIERVIAGIRECNPEFGAARVQDNNQRKPTAAECAN